MDNLGHMNMSSIFYFIENLERQIASCQKSGRENLVFCAGDGTRSLTNAAFLLGAYMILHQHCDVHDVESRFAGLSSVLGCIRSDMEYTIPPLRGVELTIRDYWNGLQQGRDVGFVSCPLARDRPNKIWGKIDAEIYTRYEDPDDGDLHEVIPGKLVAFRGPNDLGGPLHADNPETGRRCFDPEFYIDIFRALNVTAVVRLNQAEYSATAFTAHGIQHFDLAFDAATPPATTVSQFCSIVNGAQGAVAVHCRGGLGRTGTMAALYLMRSYGFSAREATAWLRIMRPGSVIGDQQRYLARVEELLMSARAAAQDARGPPSHPSTGPSALACVRSPLYDSDAGPAPSMTPRAGTANRAPSRTIVSTTGSTAASSGSKHEAAAATATSAAAGANPSPPTTVTAVNTVTAGSGRGLRLGRVGAVGGGRWGPAAVAAR
jgi:cell division cycle 14